MCRRTSRATVLAVILPAELDSHAYHLRPPPGRPLRRLRVVAIHAQRLAQRGHHVLRRVAPAAGRYGKKCGRREGQALPSRRENAPVAPGRHAASSTGSSTRAGRRRPTICRTPTSSSPRGGRRPSGSRRCRASKGKGLLRAALRDLDAASRSTASTRRGGCRCRRSRRPGGWRMLDETVRRDGRDARPQRRRPRRSSHAPPRGKQPVPTVGVMYSHVPFKGCDVALAAFRLARSERCRS